MKFIPLLKILETKPATSPVIPPPMLIIKSDLFKLFESNLFKYLLTVFKDFNFSLEAKYKKLIDNF